jgi:hypothetical protein
MRVSLHCTLKNAPLQRLISMEMPIPCGFAAFAGVDSLLSYSSQAPDLRVDQKTLQRKRLHVADTTKVEDKLERKKLKRAARKKAAPKAPRTGARGEKKKKVKKLARGVSKR